MLITALAGGVGGAKLADGFQEIVGDALSVVVNTGDDFDLHGLLISPDLDTVMYTLAGLANPATGWGLAGDTFNNLEMMTLLGAEDWFRLGDRDLATHILRTNQLHGGRTLSEVTMQLARALGVRATLLPMCDERVSTRLDTDEGELAFQEYFVHRRWHPAVHAIHFAGIERARLTPAVSHAIDRADTIVLCPSNPFVSIEPILAVPGMKDSIVNARVPRVAVSPIVGGEALKGPAAKMFRELGIEPSALAVARRYAGLVDHFVLDQVDENQALPVRDAGFKTLVTDTIMRTGADRARLAREITDWVMGAVRH